MVEVQWVIFWHGMNSQTLIKRGNSYVLVDDYSSKHANFLTDRMKAFKKMFYEDNHKSLGMRPVKYVMTIKTKKKEFRFERISTA